MAIENDKLMNLQDGQVLYNDLRDRIEGIDDFTGATSSAAGTHGLVPAPASGDDDKVLHADGTWKYVQGSGGGARVLSVTGSITNTSGSYSGTFSNSSITADMKAIQLLLGSPDVFDANVTVTCYDGYLTIACSAVAGTSTFEVMLLKSVLNSTEFDILDAAKVDKVSGATSGNFAALDSNGSLTDSGHKHGDYITSLPNASTSQAGIVQLVDGLDSTDTNKALTANQGKSLNTAIGNIDPKRGDLNTISNDTTLIALDAGTYQVVLSSGTPITSGYIPAQYGTLIVNDSGKNYKSYTFVSTGNAVYSRICHKGNSTWYTAWQQLARVKFYTVSVTFSNSDSSTVPVVNIDSNITNAKALIAKSAQSNGFIPMFAGVNYVGTDVVFKALTSITNTVSVILTAIYE